MRKARKPWITRGLQRKCNIKKNPFNKFIESRNVAIFPNYKHCRNKITPELTFPRNCYYNKFFLNPDMKYEAKWWKHLNNLFFSNGKGGIEVIALKWEPGFGEALANVFNKNLVGLALFNKKEFFQRKHLHRKHRRYCVTFPFTNKVNWIGNSICKLSQ